MALNVLCHCGSFAQVPLEFHLIKPIKAASTSASSPEAFDAPDAMDAVDASEGQTDLPQDFETALAQLEALVAKMESGALPLEESLAAYRRGVSLTRVCQERLAQAEQQVSVLEADMLRPFGASDRQPE